MHRNWWGRLLGWESVTESQWTPGEVARLLASRELERERGSHGFSLLETTDAANQFMFEGEAPIIDWAEKARLDAEDAYRKKHHSESNPVNMNGLIFRVKKRD